MMNLFLTLQINLHVDQFGHSDQVARLKLSAALPGLMNELSDARIAELGCRVVSSERRLSWMPYELQRANPSWALAALPPAVSLIPSLPAEWGMDGRHPDVEASAALLLHDAILDAAVEAFRRRILRLFTQQQAREFVHEAYWTFRNSWASDFAPNDVEIFSLAGDGPIHSIVDRIAFELFPDRLDI